MGAWLCDSFYDFHADFIVPVVGVLMKGADASGYTDSVTKYVAEVSSRLNKHGKKYLTGDQFTTADCVAATMFLVWVHNDKIAAGLKDQAIAIIATDARVQAYVETLKLALADYLMARPPTPC